MDLQIKGEDYVHKLFKTNFSTYFYVHFLFYQISGF